jgi:tartrate-resistant acid phosphatase type 5
LIKLRALALLVLFAGCKRAEPEPASRAVASASAAPSSAAAPSTSAPLRLEKLDKAPPGTIRFAVIGDYGADSPEEARVAALVKSWTVDFVVTTGDNNYPSGEKSTIDQNVGKYYAEFIGNYHGKYGPGSGQVNRFWPSPGSHDWVSGIEPYVDYFTLPGNERYYDVDLGLVHLYAVDSDPREPDGITATSVQGTWLKGRLKASKSCYDFVFFHHPPYSSSRHGSSENMRWPFREWGVEAVFTGHDHTYERFTIDGIPYFVSGLGGASKYTFPTPPLPETQFRTNDDYGALLVNATKSSMTYDFFTADGVKRDTLTTPAPAVCATK